MFGISVGFKKYAGWMSVSVSSGKFLRWATRGHIWHELALHFLVKKEFRQWGYTQDWYDGPIGYFGLGRFFLACWM